MGKIFFAINILLIFSALTAGNAAGQAYSGHEEARYIPTEANLASRQEFREAGLGIFIHWGVYSMLGDGEWVLNNQDIDYKEYAKLAGGFCPAGFDAEEWVKAIKGSGAKYICFTARHHDGFSMFGSEYTDYDITDAAPFGRDIVKELAEACHKEGLRLHLYYSLIDWGREDAPRGRTGRGTGRPEGSTDTTAYFKFMKGQLTELLGNYGEIGAIWFDGDWDMPEGYDIHDDEYKSAEELIHYLVNAAGRGGNLLLNIGPGPDGKRLKFIQDKDGVLLKLGTVPDETDFIVELVLKQITIK